MTYMILFAIGLGLGFGAGIYLSKNILTSDN
jgi:hypothetical protein